MLETSSVVRARLHAQGLLAALGDRWTHVCAVADKACRLVDAVEGPEDRDLLIAAAWLHDVGYALAVRRTGSHQLDGATHLDRAGFDARLCALVAHHSGARFEIAERRLSCELAGWADEQSPVTDALWTADMTTGPRGESTELPQRLGEILDRYGLDSTIGRAMRAAEPSIRAAVERTTERIARTHRI